MLDKFDFLISKANIHGVAPRDIPGGGKPTLTAQDVYAAMAFWTQSNGPLSVAACELGLAVYMQDPTANTRIRALGVPLVRKLFDQQKWDPTTPFQAEVNRRVNMGLLPLHLAEPAKRYRGQWLIERMTNLALDELILAGSCQQCHGRGKVHAGQCAICPACRGDGHSENADFSTHLCSIAHHYMGTLIDAPAWRWTSTACHRCGGEGFVHVLQNCKKCDGIGKVNHTQRHLARVCEVNEKTWSRLWEQRFSMVRKLFHGYLMDFEIHLLDAC